ncbi:hypothetical protein [Bradyrhizobium sp. JYMT SZCCT0180]|uniref:hypothetical protein n=1 Tax=Bradyrhizobium sp. JYMT SZCCT0180 TaxID=2807666 RepID=UPI001BA68939|nr:hypothetical protein [Bradyrhizobium sp. JYMT SZCCT0180]MBR1212010.1 hypothetical protein [Bradyrhizobium sp. JYMT SZCCT0180]
MPEIKPTVSQFIESAFAIARSKYHETSVCWTSLSGRLAPSGLVGMWANIQKLGELDLLLRCLEDELQERIATNPDGNGIDFAYAYQVAFSETWVGAGYEILRSIRQRETHSRKVGLQTRDVSLRDDFKSLFADFERLRMPIEKYEIPKDKEMKAPIRMKQFPELDATPDYSMYDKDDPNRSHLMPSGISERGSIVWLAIDHPTDSQYWVERRQLSDRMLQFIDVDLRHPTQAASS